MGEQSLARLVPHLLATHWLHTLSGCLRARCLLWLLVHKGSGVRTLSILHFDVVPEALLVFEGSSSALLDLFGPN